MTTKPIMADIEGRKLYVHQNPRTGLFYAVPGDGRRIPVDYGLIRDQTTCIQRLKYWRNRYGYTQSALAKLIHVSSPTVIMTWENGLRHPTERYRRMLNEELCPDIFPD